MKATIVMLVSAGLALGQNNPQRAAQGRGAVTKAIEAGRKQPARPQAPTIQFPQGPKLIGAPTGQPITNPGGGGTPDAVTGAASLASPGSVPVVVSPGKLTAHQGLTYDGPTSTIKLGTGDDGIEIRPKNTETFGVLSVRSTTANTPTAWDVFPNGNGQGGLGNRAWIDVCKEDLITNPAAWHCVMMGSYNDYIAIGSHVSDGQYQPLSIGGNPITFQNHVDIGSTTTFGTWSASGVQIQISGTTYQYWFANNQLRLGKDVVLGWTPNADVFASRDTSLNRRAAGELQVGIGGTGDDFGVLHAGKTDTATGAISPGLYVYHDTDGSATLGAGLNFRPSTTNWQVPDAAQVAGVWTDSTYSTRTGALTVSTVKNAAALSEVARVDHQGGTFRSVQLNPASETKPTCDATHRGRLWQTYGGAGVKDSLEVCAKDASDAYGWRVLY